MGKTDIEKINLNNADMHMHTTCSDGLFTPAEIVKRSKEMGLETIAVTDHDMVDGISEAVAAAKALGGIAVIPGIELSTEGPDGTELHILGYYIDTENEELNCTIAALKKGRKDRNAKLFEALRTQGILISKEDFDKLPDGGYIGKPMVAMKMMEKGYINQISQAFEKGKFLESQAVRAVKKEKLSTKEAISMILNAGGDPVLAHPMKIRSIGSRGSQEYWDNLDKLLKLMETWGLVGLECFYPDHTDEESAKLQLMARNRSLQVTKGSDYHGYEY